MSITPNRCSICDDAPAALRLLVTDTTGSVLDSIEACRACIAPTLALSGLAPGADPEQDARPVDDDESDRAKGGR